MATGQSADEVILVESGVVKVILPAASGPHVVTGLHGQGELLGELGVLRLQQRTATVVGHRNGVARHIRGTIFRDLVHRDRDVHAFVDATQQQRLRSADSRQLAVASMDVMSRVAAQLSEWARDHGESVNGELVVRGLSQRDLAGAVLASVKHVEAVLGDLRAAGLVITGRVCFTVPDPERLAAYPAS